MLSNTTLTTSCGTLSLQLILTRISNKLAKVSFNAFLF